MNTETLLETLDGMTCISTSVDTYRPEAMRFTADTFDLSDFYRYYPIRRVEVVGDNIVVSGCDDDTRATLVTYIFTADTFDFND